MSVHLRDALKIQVCENNKCESLHGYVVKHNAYYCRDLLPDSDINSFQHHLLSTAVPNATDMSAIFN